jgi:hypothetical protein
MMDENSIKERVDDLNGKINILKEEIVNIQRICPHENTTYGISRDFYGNPFYVICLDCGLERDKRGTWEEGLPKVKK